MPLYRIIVVLYFLKWSLFLVFVLSLLSGTYYTWIGYTKTSGRRSWTNKMPTNSFDAFGSNSYRDVMERYWNYNVDIHFFLCIFLNNEFKYDPTTDYNTFSQEIFLNIPYFRVLTQFIFIPAKKDFYLNRMYKR